MNVSRYLRAGRTAVLLILICLALGACSNMRWGTSAGVDVRFGPSGPQVVPRMNIGVYSGGRF